MIKKIFDFIKKIFGLFLDGIYFVGAFIFNKIKKLVLLVVGVLKS